MNIFTALVVGIYAITTLTAIIIVIVLIFRRIKQKRSEDFEKREN